ncbi:hypothetical protein LG299_12485 [Microbacterium lacus]|uniref:hypothetical protein n=1 Tax=Microbacterium lacus TaxID=415217 RepID=UPI00384BE8FF
MISITESFCADRLLALAEAEIDPTANDVRSTVWDRAATTTVSTWEGIRGGYRDWFQIKPNWPSLEPLVEVRNAIAHGLGNLTRIQKKNPQGVRDKLALAGITLDEDRVLLDEADITQIRSVCVALVVEIDELVQARSVE